MATAGDLFLSFIGNEIHIDIAYKNHSGFISCFILRSIRIEKPVFVIRDFDLVLGCQGARIEPDFRELADKKAIILKCALKNVAFLRAGEKLSRSSGIPPKAGKGAGDLLGLFGSSLPPLLEELVNVLFVTVDTELRVFGGTLEFRSFKAESRDIKVTASGFVRETGDTQLSLKIFFSPEIIATFPEELRAVLTPGVRGWSSYHIELESGRAKPFLKLETDRFRLEFKEIQEG